MAFLRSDSCSILQGDHATLCAGTITVCIAAYAPFVFPASYRTVPSWAQIAHTLPDGVYSASNASMLIGYEIEFAQARQARVVMATAATFPAVSSPPL